MIVSPADRRGVQKLPLQVAAGRCHTHQAPVGRDHQVGNDDDETGVISIPKLKS